MKHPFILAALLVSARCYAQQADISITGFEGANVDQIMQSERKIASAVPDATREFVAEKRYLNIPINDKATRRSVALLVDGKLETEHSNFRVGLADGKPDWWAAYDISHLKGKKIALKVNLLPGNSTALESIEQSNEVKDANGVYQGSRRPQLYFSPQRGGCGDANGLVYYEGEYHLFFQHNPFFADGGINSHWGHAISTDLVHWKQMPDALRPDDRGVIYSGSSVVDLNNTTGMQSGNEKPMIAVYTSQGKTVSQCAAYSNDRGRTWVKYAGNPLLAPQEPGNRDPKVLWHQPTRKWVMVICYGWPGNQTGRPATNPNYGFYTSPDLKNWERTCTINVDNATDCPEFFEIPVDGDKAKTKWIFYTGKATYLIGTFDGKVFTPESGPYELDRGGNFYASQTFNNIPEKDGRRILMAHCSGGGNGTGFWGGISLPVELTLRTTDEGLRLFTYPVKELEKLRVKSHEIAPQALKAGVNPLADVQGELLELFADVAVGEASMITFDLRGVPATFDAAKQEFSCQNRSVPLKPVDGRIRLRAYVDRAAIFLFPNDGRYYMPVGASPSPDNLSLKLSAQGDGAKIQSLQIHELKSIWK